MGWRHQQPRLGVSRMMVMVMLVMVIGVVLTILNIYHLHHMRDDHTTHITDHNGDLGDKEMKGQRSQRAPVVWIHGKKMESGYLDHVKAVFARLGFKLTTGHDDWDVMWTHDYPFKSLSGIMTRLLPHQKVNHFPGLGYITNKVNLATSASKSIPKAFKMPQQKDEFLKHAQAHPQKLWVQKSNTHRGIKIKSIDQVDFTANDSFVQEFISKPLLVDGRKFDIGVYTIITSIDPLIVYTVDDETLVRFCSRHYYPFDTADVTKYVIGDNYTPMWQVTALKDMFEKKGFSFKETLNKYLATKGVNVTRLWSEIHDTIRTIFKEKQASLVAAESKYKPYRNFFELVRFDFVFDENAKVYLMEVNMSPNLSTGHFTGNRLLYEHVIYNALRLAGVASLVENPFRNISKADFEMQVSWRDIAVFPDWCTSLECDMGCTSLKCLVCNPCMSLVDRQDYKTAYLEHVNRGGCRRILPHSLSQEAALKWSPEKDQFGLDLMSPRNRKLFLWFLGMCRKDVTFCV